MGCIESFENIHDGLTSSYNVYDITTQPAECLDYHYIETKHYEAMRRYKRITLRRRYLRKTNRNIENSARVIQLCDSKIIQQEELKFQTTKLTTELLKRSSSFMDDICIHCEHKHLWNCCQYYYDTIEQALEYAQWKSNLEKFRSIDILSVTGIPEAICGNFSPIQFPGYTHKNPKEVFFGTPNKNFQIKASFLWLRKLIRYCHKRHEEDEKELVMNEKIKDYLEMSLRSKGIFIYMV